MKISRPNRRLIVTALAAAVGAAALPFPLTDTGPAAPDFRARFLGSYGINAKIEPEITADDRPLYERIEPFLRSDPQRAIEEVEAALGPEANPAFYFLLGNLLYQQNAYDRAERALETALRGFPDFRRAHRTLGLIHIQTERFPQAVGSWLKVITLGGGDAQSYGLLAYAYLNLEKFESALSAYEMARMFKPDSVDFRRGQAQCLLALGRHDRAAALFDELIAERPDTHDYWLLQANAFLELERYADAISNLEILRASGEADRNARFLLGDLHLRDGNHRLALRSYEEALRVAPVESLDRALRPLNYLVNRGLFEEASAYLDTLGQTLPEGLGATDAARLVVAEAGIELKQGSPLRAVALLEPLVERDPLNATALLLLGEAHHENGADEEATFYLQRALSLPEAKPEALIALGRIAVDRGDFEAALEHLYAARELDPRPALQRYIDAV
ncbi:MAG: tetratricopeptide repeat protein, partial [Verrucomicrobiota bacterium]